MIESFALAAELRQQLDKEARQAFPRECCGLIEGVLEHSRARALVLHAAANLADAPDRFEIDPAAQFALLRNLRGTGRAVIGCYHSHPNGGAEPSASDLASATDEGFLWLIAALEENGAGPRIAAFVSAGASFTPVRIESSQ